MFPPRAAVALPTAEQQQVRQWGARWKLVACSRRTRLINLCFRTQKTSLKGKRRTLAGPGGKIGIFTTGVHGHMLVHQQQHREHSRNIVPCLTKSCCHAYGHERTTEKNKPNRLFCCVATQAFEAVARVCGQLLIPRSHADNQTTSLCAAGGLEKHTDSILILLHTVGLWVHNRSNEVNRSWGLWHVILTRGALTLPPWGTLYKALACTIHI